MPFHQKVDTEARLTRMIEDMGITLNPVKPEKQEEGKEKPDQKETNRKNE
ncbi:hypothetical protein [Sporolactobacillus shoreae]|nr:hypothetical protein [Sporolactobacillus shoreae]